MSAQEKLFDIVPEAPDFKINWELIENGIMKQYAADMRTVNQNPKYHAEGDVWRHTVMVCEELVRDPDFRACSLRCRRELFIAALFHDVGKIKTTRLENGEWTSPRHAQEGALTVRDMLVREYGMSGTRELQSFRETVCFLVRYHMVAPYIMESDKSDRKLIKLAANGEMIEDFSLRLLLILSRADSNGKIAEDSRKGEETVLLAAELAKESGCYESPVRFASPFTEHAYLSGRNVTPDTLLYDDSLCEVIMMCGLPGVGKDTYIKENFSGYPVISLDDIREEYRLSPVGSQQDAARIAKARAKALLREKRSFVWNATNITADIRTKLIALFESYHAYVKIVYLETDYKTDHIRNAEREKPVPAHVIDNMLAKLSPPERYEAHEVIWECI